MKYLYRCPKHGEFHSALQKGAMCPVVVYTRSTKVGAVCGRKGIRQFGANVHFHPTKGDAS